MSNTTVDCNTTSSLMDKLREKPGIVAVGAAALATAGYLLYKSIKGGNKDSVDDA